MFIRQAGCCSCVKTFHFVLKQLLDIWRKFSKNQLFLQVVDGDLLAFVSDEGEQVRRASSVAFDPVEEGATPLLLCGAEGIEQVLLEQGPVFCSGFAEHKSIYGRSHICSDCTFQECELLPWISNFFACVRGFDSLEPYMYILLVQCGKIWSLSFVGIRLGTCCWKAAKA